MGNELTLRNLDKYKRPQNVFTDFSLPFFNQELLKDEKNNFLRILCRSAIEADVIVQGLNVVKLEVIIPEALRNAMASGKAHFDKSNKIKGDYAPSIRMNDGSGIKGNVTLRPEFDPSAISGCLANLSYMMMLEKVIDNLETIDSKLDNLLIGQKSDRFSKVIGPFISYYSRLSEYKSEEEKRNAANTALINMQQGLVSIHNVLEATDYQELLKAPKNGWQAFINELIHNRLHKKRKTFVYRKMYAQFVYDLTLYYKFILLKDVLQLTIGDSMSTIEKYNHVPFEELCKRLSSKDFLKKMELANERKVNELQLLSEHSHDDRILLAQPASKIIIPLDEKDIQLIQQEYENTNS